MSLTPQDRQRLAVAIPLAACLLIAARQHLLAHDAGLSPWRGGGFGMFATVDSPDARFVRAFLLNDRVDCPIELPDHLDNFETRLATVATPAVLEAFARTLASIRWRDLMADTQATVRCVIPFEDQPPHTLRVELWRYDHDAPHAMLHARRLHVVELPL